LSISLLNIDRFSQFFHRRTQLELCNKVINKDPTSPQMCCYKSIVSPFLTHGVYILCMHMCCREVWLPRKRRRFRLRLQTTLTGLRSGHRKWPRSKPLMRWPFFWEFPTFTFTYHISVWC